MAIRKRVGAFRALGDNNDIMLALRFAEKLRTQKDSVITVRLHQDSDMRRATDRVVSASL